MWVGTCVQLKMNKPSIVCIDNFLQQHDCLFPSPWRFFGCIHSGFCVISVQALLPPLTELFLCTNRPRAVPDGPNSSIWQVLWLTQPPFVSRVCFSQHWRQEGKILDELFVCNFSESSLIRKKKTLWKTSLLFSSSPHADGTPPSSGERSAADPFSHLGFL